MAITNAPAAVDIPLDAFLGLVTESDITSLPPGASPDNQDITFVPGGFDSRPGLHKIFAAPAPNNPTMVYEKTFVQDNEKPLNLFLDSNGIFYQEDVTNNPGVLTQVHVGTPGLYAQSVTAFGREFIAFSDGVHGADVPRQYDGTFFDRVTQDGPAAAITIADIQSTVGITSVTLAASVAITATSGLDLGGGRIQFSYTTAAPHGIAQGQAFLVQGVANATYNGVFVAVNVPSTTTITFVSTGAVPAASAGGTLGAATVTMVTAAPHGMFVGDAFTFTGNGGSLDNNEPGNPTYWVVASVTNSTTLVFNLSNQFGILQGGQASTTGGAGGTLSVGGLISVGDHQVVCIFVTRFGYFTAPGPSVKWSAVGNKQALATNIPIGPPNVVQRVLAFTGSGGANYFYIPATVSGGGNTTVLNDNTTTQLVIDFSDNTLFASIAIDITGNDLFAQRVLGPCVGFTVYGSRLGAWGEYRRLENLLNMGFEGGTLSGSPNAPLGWTVGANPGVLDSGASDFGLAWKITGDGTANARGVLTQPAYQDRFGVAIAPPNEPLTFRLWAKASAAGLNGNIQAILSAASTGFSSTASIAINTCSTSGGFVQANFSQAMPAVIPSDMILTIQEKSLNNLATIELDELEIIFTSQPYLDGIAYFSYPENPEAFDANTGKLQPTDDDSSIRFFSQLRRWLVMVTAQGMHRTIDTVGEPGDWDVDPITGSVGGLSFRAGDPGKFGKGDAGEEWIVVAGYAGMYLYGGGPLWKISQENQPVWDRINKAAQHTLWVKNDPNTRRIYMGLPLDEATAPNAIYVVDYRELDTDQQIAAAASVRVGYNGRVIATDMGRKWTKWSIDANCGEVLARPNNVYTFCLAAGNGVTPGQQNGFGNIYFLDPAKLTDDDYGQIVPYWFSHLFPTHDDEKTYQLGGGRKDFVYSFYYASGVGQLVVTPYAGSLTNPRTASLARTLNLTQNNDIEIPLNVTASRVAFKIAVQPLQGQTDVQLSVSKMIISIRKAAMSPLRGAR